MGDQYHTQHVFFFLSLSLSLKVLLFRFPLDRNALTHQESVRCLSCSV